MVLSVRHSAPEVEGLHRIVIYSKVSSTHQCARGNLYEMPGRVHGSTVLVGLPLEEADEPVTTGTHSEKQLALGRGLPP